MAGVTQRAGVTGFYGVTKDHGVGGANISALASRYFTTISSTLSQYWAIPAVTYSDGFDWTFEIEGGAGTFGRILGNAGSFLNGVRIDSTNTSVTLTANGGPDKTLSFDSALDRTQLNTLHVTRPNGSSTVSAYVNGVLQTATITESAAYTFDGIGLAYTTFNNGIIANMDLQGGDGGDNRFYPINETWVGSTDLIDTVGGQNGTFVNGGPAYADPYDFNGSVSPSTWTNQNPPNNVIEVAGT